MQCSLLSCLTNVFSPTLPVPGVRRDAVLRRAVPGRPGDGRGRGQGRHPVRGAGRRGAAGAVKVQQEDRGEEVVK